MAREESKSFVHRVELENCEIRAYLLLVLVAMKTVGLTCRPIEAYNFILYGCAVKEEGP